MGVNTDISWCDSTQNFWIGCTKVSAGCAHCYAEARDIRFNGGLHWGKGAPRQRTSASNWREPLKWNREAAARGCGDCDPCLGGRPDQCAVDPSPRPRVFCSSLSDIFDSEIAIEWFVDALHVIYECQNLDWQLLTKRPENFAPRMEAASKWFLDIGTKMMKTEENKLFWFWLEGWRNGTPPTNIWMGTSVENQECANERIPELLKIPAKIRFLSCEPLLGPVDLAGHGIIVSGIHWVIIGGESGKHARPFAVEWAKSLVAQCRAAGVALFVKQLGARPIHDFVGYPGSAIDRGLHLRDPKGGDMSEWPEDLRIREFPFVEKEASAK